MFNKKSWLSGGVWKPKNLHSLEHLKYLYGVLGKNQTVSEQNLSLLVETLRSISEILIWGDQNDSSVFDFFLEKNMLLFFLRFMRQKTGRFICVQLLQTLNILFDNINNETSVYYLLSNNHINSIIAHKFDFTDEEVMAYYISFLKTLSLKLNRHTVHFFFNEHTNDFALYTEAIKFFNHQEGMVRIAVRTITLNVYNACKYESKLDEQDLLPVADDNNCMLRYIRDKTAAPYFSNLVWFIGTHLIQLDACVRQDVDHNSRDRLSGLVAEHLDHLHYLNDILCLDIDAINNVLTDYLLNRLFIPLYIYSLIGSSLKDESPAAAASAAEGPEHPVAGEESNPRLRPVVSLFLLSQVFLIIRYAPLVRQLSDIIINGELPPLSGDQHFPQTAAYRRVQFVKPAEDLAKTFSTLRRRNKKQQNGAVEPSAEPGASGVTGTTEPRGAGSSGGEMGVEAEELPTSETSSEFDENEVVEALESLEVVASAPEVKVVEAPVTVAAEPNPNSTDEEKEKLLKSSVAECSPANPDDVDLERRPYLSAVYKALDCSEDDYKALFALCLLYALAHNTGINQDLLDSVQLPTDRSETKHHYSSGLVQRLIQVMSLACQTGSKVRLATLELTVLVLQSLVYRAGHCFLQDGHLAAVEGVREEATLLLRSFYKSEEIFLDMFEDEYRELSSRPLNIEYLMMDASVLLPPTGTPLTGIDFSRRLPCGEVERARRAIRVLFMVRKLSYTLRAEPETQLPLTTDDECVKVDDVLDLNNSDLIACTIISKDNKKERRFLVIDVIQLILVEPDSKRLGWGVVRFVGFLQDVEVAGEKDDSRCLHITIHKPTMNFPVGGGSGGCRPLPLLSARFLFDDHIRCMAAKQRLTKGRLRARQRKMQMIARLLDLPPGLVDSMYQGSASSGGSAGGSAAPTTGLKGAAQRGGGGGRPGSAARLAGGGGGVKFPGGALPGRSHVVMRQPTGTSSPTPTPSVPTPSSPQPQAASAPTPAPTVPIPPVESSNDTVVQRSVFASVDQSPVFAAAKEQQQEQGGVGIGIGGAAGRRVGRGGGAGLKAEQKQKLLSQALQVVQRSKQRAAEAAESRRDGLESAAPPGGGGQDPPKGSAVKQGRMDGGIAVEQARRKKSDASGSAVALSASRSAARRLSADSASKSPSPDRVRSGGSAPVAVRGRGGLQARASSGASLDQQVNGGVDAAEFEMVTPKKGVFLGAPKTLTPAEGLHVSLVDDAGPLPRHSGALDSPVKLLPPARADDIHRLPPAAAAGSASDTSVALGGAVGGLEMTEGAGGRESREGGSEDTDEQSTWT